MALESPTDSAVLWALVRRRLAAGDPLPTAISTSFATTIHPIPTDPDPTDPPLQLSGQTLRQIVHVGLGGARVRLRLSNAYGTTALKIGAIHVALHKGGAAIVSGSDRAVTFSGASNVVVPPGALVVSDPVSLVVSPSSDLSVSLFVPDPTSATTVHAIAGQTTYLSAPGDFSGAEELEHPTMTTSWYFVAGVDVEGAPRSRAIVALGDSITDGVGAKAEANHRWPDRLPARLNATTKGPPRAMVNAGIAGNRVLGDVVANIRVRPNALALLDRDVLTQPGAGYVIVFEGANDLGTHAPHPEVSAEDGAFGCRGWTARMSGDQLELDGDGERIDGLRALCAAAWNAAAAAGGKAVSAEAASGFRFALQRLER